MRRPSIDEQLDAIDIAAIVRSQKNHGFCDLVRRPDAAQGSRGGGLRGCDPERTWRSAFISKFGSTSARPALLGIALGASLGQAWRQLRRWIARSRQRHALAELDDRLLRDIGVIRERDIGVSREEARREIELFWRT